MKREIYMAPMEGVTTYIFRQVFNKYFGGIDKYFTPFISPDSKNSFNNKDLKEFLPDNNKEMKLVPQIITKDADLFIKAVEDISEYGYEEFNLNCGCPSGTVVAKGRGAGMLADTEKLDEFLDKIFDKCDKNISIKTRIGITDESEWDEILKVYTKYPISELIIHPRTRKDYYKNDVNKQAFKKALTKVKIPICYNGDIFLKKDYEKFDNDFASDNVNVMLGRGLVANPTLADKITSDKKYDKAYIRKYYDELFGAYSEVMGSDRNTLFKMKEMWTYMICIFDDSSKHWKKIKKAKSLIDYKDAVDRLFADCHINFDKGFRLVK